MEQGSLLHMPICSDKFEWSFLACPGTYPAFSLEVLHTTTFYAFAGARSELDKAHKTPRFTWSISDKHIEFLE